MSLKKTVSSLIRSVKNNLPLILTVGSGIGIVTTSILSADAAVKTHEAILKKQEDDRFDIYKRYLEQNNFSYENVCKICEITPTENYKLSAKEAVSIWWKTALSGGLTLASIVCNHRVNAARQASLALMASTAASMYTTYRNTNIDVNGKEADDKVIDEIIKSNKMCFNVGDFDFNTSDPNEKVCFYDEHVGYFEMTPYDMLKAQYHLNRVLATEGDISLTRWFEFLGIDDHIKDREYCDTHGFIFDELITGQWNDLPWFDIFYCGADLDDGLKAYGLDYIVPIIDLDEDTWAEWM